MPNHRRSCTMVLLAATAMSSSCTPPPPAVEAPPPAAEKSNRMCILEAGQLRKIDAMVNATTGDKTGYAAGADFFVKDQPITFRDRRYVRFGLARPMRAADVQPIGGFQRVRVFAEAGADQQNPEVLYVLVRPDPGPICEFQPYRET